MTERSLEEILRSGESLYLGKFKEELEKSFYGHYAAIDVDTGEYVVKENKLEAVEEARRKFNNRLVYIVQVGSLDKPSVNHRANQHAWSF
ncbi:MAG: hypothetical protein Q7S26_02850 [bacterium]|nr:hypothetical protein [bacterium]